MTTKAYTAQIFIAGDIHQIEKTCREYTLIGLCVTVTPTTFVFTGGAEAGAIVGLINYPRFPSTPQQLREHSISLAMLLLSDCCQRSCTVQTPEESTYLENPAVKVSR